MKKFAFILFLIALVACSNTDERKKILPDYETDYNYQALKYSTKPDVLYFKNKIAPAIVKDISEYLSKYEKTYLLRIRIFVDEDGKLDYVKFVEEPHFMQKNFDIEEDIISLVDKHNLPIIKIDGSPSKSAFDLTIKSGNAFDEEEYSVAVEKMPSIVGGISSLSKNIKYPEEAKKYGIEGKVFVRVFIDEKGNVVKAEVFKGIGFGCDDAALTAVRKLHFIPGELKGKPVKTQITIPVVFKLK